MTINSNYLSVTQPIYNSPLFFHDNENCYNNGKLVINKLKKENIFALQ